MPGKKARKNAQPSPARAPAGGAGSAHAEAECALQLRRIGDKLNFRQKLLNLVSKLFHLGT
ncbi:phorbol-12-myristate-13-acetate-induced protein 1 isoform X2 [Pteronotus mesoamericanus]|uniref:phorbol-12-myristate-13-acetate-induced protein 1 isoform X2 n=1 Tax=Pteronotus mesoamericanus TaxID=1884717 RepID=UPI0023ECAA20|nr:phorbol-12-myristate-13-acetate-induced protein 1 isoform X2 [Pteronotus parnellii mesoamericanus]